jgi:hypothetical protein
VTSTDGSYFFGNLPVGTYSVAYIDSSILTPDSVQPGSTGGTPNGLLSIVTIVIPAGTASVNNNFGMIQTSTG